MKDRIKQIRKKAGLTQVEFGEKLGVKGNTVTGYETGLRNPTDAVILSICREFSVNEDWLRTGQGDMFKPQTKNEELLSFVNDVMELEDDSFKKKLVNALTKLDTKDWEYLETIASKLLKNE